jgi:hypothetical protein
MHRQFGRSPLEIGGLRAVPASPLNPPAEDQKRELPAQSPQALEPKNIRKPAWILRDTL